MRGALLAASSGALLLLAAPPLDLTPLALLALAPLLYAARRAAGVRRAAALGWLSGVVFHVGLLPWLPATIARMQGTRWPAATALFLAYVGYEAFRFALLAVAAHLGRTLLGRVAATTGTWVLVETVFPQPLPWSLGAALGPHRLLRQSADLAGAHGLAALVVAVNALVATAAGDWTAQRARAGAALAIAATLVIGAASYGAWRRGWNVPPSAPTGWRIAVVQAGESGDDREEPQKTAAAWNDYARLTSTSIEPAGVILWPEGVMGVYLRSAPDWRARAEALARRMRSSLVIGALDRTADGAELNAAYVFTPALAAVIYKTVLVPFGEYVPHGGRWPRLGWHPPAPRRAGPSPLVVDVGARLAPSICFEAILPGHFNAAARAGAELLINLSDDSWFDSPWAAAQHLEMTRLRAVETRRWLVRASHSGISAVIDARGEIVAALPYGTRGTIVQMVQRGAELTPYARWGEAPLQMVCAAALLLAVWRAALPRRRRTGIRDG